VLVAGYYGSGNTGDEAILTVVLQDLRALRPDLEFVVVSADPAATAARHRVRGVSEADIPAILDAAQQSDLVLLGGGGVFHDYWGCPPDSILTRRHAGIPFYAGFPLLAVLTGRPCMIYAAGVGPLHSEEGRRLTRAAFEAAGVATVRDAASRDLLEAVGVTGVRVTADPAFNLRPDLDRARTILAGLCPEPPAPRIAVCLRNWIEDDRWAGWEDQVARGLDAFIERTGAFVVFVPFQALMDYVLTDDVAAARRVMDRMARSQRVVSVPDGHDPETVAGILAGCDLVVGMRLHALLFAASAGVPAVGLAYDTKVTSLMADLGLAEYALTLDAASDLGARMATALARREAIRDALGATTARLRERAAQNAALALSQLDAPRPSCTPTAQWVSIFALRQARHLAEQEAHADELSARILDREEQLAAAAAHADALEAQVATLTSGTVWQVAQRLRGMRRRLAPPGTRRDLAVARIAATLAREGLAASLSRGPRRVGRAAARWLGKPRGVWALDSRQEEDPSVTLYTDRDDLFPDYRPRRPVYAARRRRVTVSLIATARNERSSVPAWLASLAAQTRVPDEIVVVDAGSTDGTADALQTEAARRRLNLKVLVEPGASIARGRNLAIERTRGDVLAATDLGCRLTPTWLERIVAPFEDDEAIQVVAGWYVALERGRPRQRRRWPVLDGLDPGTFLPSSRSIAFSRDAWAAVGGYPEWLTLTGEDTWFGLELRRFCARWAFVPEAVVEWNAPTTMTEYWRKIYAWSVGDGESGVGAPLYWRSCRRVAGALAAAAAGAIAVAVTTATLGATPALLMLGGAGAVTAAVVARRWGSLGSPGAVAWEAGGEAARVIGFLRGAARRQAVAARRHRGARGIAFILSGVPIDDTGGGARATQLALEMLKRHWHVVFVSRFPRHESTNLGLRICHPRLHTASLGAFAWRRFVRDHAVVFREHPVAAIVEFPLAEFVPLLRAIRAAGGSVVYDLLDAWDSALGGQWYSPAVERRVIALSDVLVATATPLAARLATMSGRDVALVPNAVNPDLFDPRRPWARPADVPPAPWSMIYVGALWGDWFDWDLLRRLALVYRDAAVVMIGDYRNQMYRPPANVHFLGLKPQAELPAYLAHAEVAILPWKANAVTHATSPLKIYEYLAMRRPVVAPRLDALEGIPGVLLSHDADAFVRNVGRARRVRLDAATVDAFVRANSWPARIRTLLGLLARAAPRMASAPPVHATLTPRDDVHDQ
jgi:polysaccharide pyruvyl transferase CsaB